MSEVLAAGHSRRSSRISTKPNSPMTMDGIPASRSIRLRCSRLHTPGGASACQMPVATPSGKASVTDSPTRHRLPASAGRNLDALADSLGDLKGRMHSLLARSRAAKTAEAQGLIDILRECSPADIARLMKLSDALAQLNAARYAAWSSTFSSDNARQALFAFNGDVYEGLDAWSLNLDDLAWAQDHVRTLSGLYGVLRPLDWMQPYRLEMGTKLANPHGNTLYAYWGSRIAQALNEQQAQEAAPVVINLASQEYFKSVDLQTLRAQVVECVFEDYKGGQYKIISFYAKRARGLMARWAIQHRAETPAQLQGFDLDGYAWCASVSAPDRLVFRRDTPTASDAWTRPPSRPNCANGSWPKPKLAKTPQPCWLPWCKRAGKKPRPWPPCKPCCTRKSIAWRVPKACPPACPCPNWRSRTTPPPSMQAIARCKCS